MDNQPAFKQLTIEDYSRPYKINHGTEDGQVAPICAIGLEFQLSKERFWNGVWLRVGAPKEEIAEALTRLAEQIKAGKFSSVGEEQRLEREVNFEDVKHLMPGQSNSELAELTKRVEELELEEGKRQQRQRDMARSV